MSEPTVTVDPKILEDVRDRLVEAKERLDERNGNPSRSFWVERAIALIAAIVFGLAGWVWHTEGRVQHIEDVMYPASSAGVLAQNQATILTQLREIQRRLQRIEDAR